MFNYVSFGSLSRLVLSSSLDVLNLSGYLFIYCIIFGQVCLHFIYTARWTEKVILGPLFKKVQKRNIITQKGQLFDVFSFLKCFISAIEMNENYQLLTQTEKKYIIYTYTHKISYKDAIIRTPPFPDRISIIHYSVCIKNWSNRALPDLLT